MDDQCPLDDFFARVYRPLRLRGGSENTSRLYAAAIGAFSRTLRRRATLADLDDLTLASFLERRAMVDRRSPYTVERERSALMALARLAFERRLLASMPTCPPGKLPRRVPKAWTAEEFARLVAAARGMNGRVGANQESVFWPAILFVAWETGERVSAIMAARARDLVRRPDGSATLAVSPESRKGGREGRVYDLSPATAEALARLSPDGRDALFEWPYSRTHLWGRLGAILRRAGLSGRRVGFHQIRRTAASHFAAAGGSAAEFLGHAAGSGDRVATRWYVDPTLLPRRPAWQLLPPVEP
jgi:integrase